MIVPQPEDLDISNFFDSEHRFKMADLFEKPSPVLPLHFDKSYLPKNICEREYIDLFECVLFRNTDKSSSCSYNITRFQNCRKRRDLQILDSIKKWETAHIEGMTKKNSQFYVQGMTFKLDRLKQEYSKMPSTQAKQFKLAQIESEINQIKWRMKYIKQLIQKKTDSQ